MGKLADCWALLRETQDPAKIKEIQDKINSIESWCIENNYAGIKELTDWRKWEEKKKTKKTYRFESVKDGGFGIPKGAFVGKERCGCCKYNNHPWCDRGVTKPCMANV